MVLQFLHTRLCKRKCHDVVACRTLRRKRCKWSNLLFGLLYIYAAFINEKTEDICRQLFFQNKNKYIVEYFHSIVHSNLEEIQVFYPLPGHSRLPCDRDFARIEKRRGRKDRVVNPSEWVGLVKENDISNPFKICFVEHPLTDNVTSDGTPVASSQWYCNNERFVVQKGPKPQMSLFNDWRL